MGWKEVQAVYLTRDQNLGGKNVEDLLARRVLEGMGYKDKHIAQLEAALAGRKYADETLWRRTARVFTLALLRGNLRTMTMANSWEVMAQETDAKHKQVMERFDLLKDMTKVPARLPLIFARVKDTANGLAFVSWEAARLWELNPPYKAVHCMRIGDDYDGRIIVQEASHFVKSLMDYKQVIRLEDADE